MDNLNLNELKAKAKQLGLKGYSKMKKQQLIDLINNNNNNNQVNEPNDREQQLIKMIDHMFTVMDYRALYKLYKRNKIYADMVVDYIKKANPFNDFQWDKISTIYGLSIDFMKTFHDKLNWYLISMRQNLSDDAIRTFHDKLNWDEMSMYQTLSEDIIREFQDKVNWYRISFHQHLSEEFIMEFKDKVHWKYILETQNLSASFIHKIMSIYEIIEISDDTECSICLIADDEIFVKTKCNHVFHQKCVDLWLTENDTCPYCRTIIKRLNI